MMRQRKLLVQQLGLVDYESALAIQKKTELAVKTGVQPDTLLLLEHPHTLTIGAEIDDRIAHDLAQPVISHFSTAIGFEERYVARFELLFIEQD